LDPIGSVLGDKFAAAEPVQRSLWEFLIRIQRGPICRGGEATNSQSDKVRNSKNISSGDGVDLLIITQQGI